MYIADVIRWNDVGGVNGSREIAAGIINLSLLFIAPVSRSALQKFSLVKITTMPLWQFTADYSIDYKVVDRVTDRWRWRCVELRSVTFAGERWRAANFVMQSNKSTFSFRSFDVKLGGFDVDTGRSSSLLPVRIFTCGYRQFGKKKLFDRKCRSYHH